MSIDSTPIVVEQAFNATVDDAWKAITDPDQMRQWYFDTINDFKAEVGFETVVDVECEAVVYSHLWKVTEVVLFKKLAQERRYRGYPGDSVVVWDLAKMPDGSKLTLTHNGNETFPQDLAVFRRESCESGWKYFLQESLKAFLER